MLLVGCNKLKPTEKAEDAATAASEWSCTNQENLNHIQAALKKEYLKQIDRSLRQSDYQSDYDILDKINKGLKFEITNVRTLEAEWGSINNQIKLRKPVGDFFPERLTGTCRKCLS